MSTTNRTTMIIFSMVEIRKKMFKNRAPSLFITVLYTLVTIVGVFTCGLSNSVLADTSTPEDRAALFDYILAKTLEREAFSPIKNRRLGLDIEKEMQKYRSELIAADTDEKLFYALVKISNARKDRHLKVSLVEGGLSLPGAVGDDFLIPHAPIRFYVDFSRPGYYFVFVSDYAQNIRDYAEDKFPEIAPNIFLCLSYQHESFKTTQENEKSQTGTPSF